MKEELLRKLKTFAEINPDSYDGSYLLVRETVKAYIGVDEDILDYTDLDCLYHMVIGTWKSGIELKINNINKSHLPNNNKVKLIAVLEEIWRRACNNEYINREGNKSTIGMFGTGYFTTKGETDIKSPGSFMKLCKQLLDMDDDIKMYDTAERVLKQDFRGFATASASAILHCLKPYTFPVINNKMGFVYAEIGINSKTASEVRTYVDNCRKIKSFRDANLPYRNYRVLDIADMELTGEKEVAMNNKYVDREKDVTQKSWIISANPKIYKHEEAFKRGYIEWSQVHKYSIGDIVYIYVSDQIKKVRYKTTVDEIDIRVVNTFSDKILSKSQIVKRRVEIF